MTSTNNLEGKPAPCRVKITQCSFEQGWYRNRIGEIFEVDNASTPKDYVLWEDYTGNALAWRHIAQIDCERVYSGELTKPAAPVVAVEEKKLDLATEKKRFELLEDKLSKQISETGNNELFDTFLDWMDCRNNLNANYITLLEQELENITPTSPEVSDSGKVYSIADIEKAFKECYKTGKVHPGNNMNKDWEAYKKTLNQ